MKCCPEKPPIEHDLHRIVRALLESSDFALKGRNWLLMYLLLSVDVSIPITYVIKDKGEFPVVIPPISRLAKLGQIKESTVKRNIKKLEKMGYLIINDFCKKGDSSYLLNLEKIFLNQFPEENIEGDCHE